MGESDQDNRARAELDQGDGGPSRVDREFDEHSSSPGERPSVSRGPE